MTVLSSNWSTESIQTLYPSKLFPRNQQTDKKNLHGNANNPEEPKLSYNKTKHHNFKPQYKTIVSKQYWYGIRIDIQINGTQVTV